MKDDSGSYAVFTEQGSSASQMTAAKSNGYHLQTAFLRGTSSGRSICFFPGFHTLKIFVLLHGLMTWRVMQRNVWSDTVS